MNKHTTAASLADALEALAAELRKTPVADFPGVWLQVSLQALTHCAPRADRFATVDRLATVLQLAAPRDAVTYGANRELTAGVHVSVYTGTMTDEDNDRLQF